MADIQKKVKSLPTTPGVYLYKDGDGNIIYIGKAVNLKRRVKQYFDKGQVLSVKTQQLVSAVMDIDHMETVTEFDALLLESNLIRTYQPKYNSIAKDDKSPIYIQLSIEEELPRVRLVRKPNNPTETHTFYAGPFQTTKIAKSILRSIRRCIPFCTQKQRDGKPCFYTHIGLCHPCPSEIEKQTDSAQKRTAIRQYRKNIFRIKHILEGKLLPVIGNLEREMKQEAALNHFEQAAVIRDRISSMKQLLSTHFDPSLYIDDAVAIGETVEHELEDLRTVVSLEFPAIASVKKIECIDISNTAGCNPVGSLVVMENGIIDRAQYRRFTVHDTVGPNDTAMMYEVVMRRFKHPEWPFPDLLLVDGGKGQVSAAETALKHVLLTIPVIGLAKRYESVVMRQNNVLKLIHLSGTRPAIRILKRIRDESHRFALAYHRLKRAKTFKAD